MYKIFVLDDRSDMSTINEQLRELQFCTEIKCSKMIESRNVEQRFYTLISEILSSDCLLVNGEKCLSFNDGSVVTITKLYKIPTYVYNYYDDSTSCFCNELCVKCFKNLALLLSYLNEVNQNNKLISIQDRVNPDDILLKINAFDAGYDLGYSETEKFWGVKPAFYVQLASKYLVNRNGVQCIDLGCGTGKNAIYLNSKGFSVEAVDSSYYAIVQAKAIS